MCECRNQVLREIQKKKQQEKEAENNENTQIHDKGVNIKKEDKLGKKR